MSTIGPLIQLYEEDFINQQGFRDACKSPTLPREQRRFLGIQYLRYFNEDVTEAKLDAFLEGSEVPWIAPAPIGVLTMEEKRHLVEQVMETLGIGIGQILVQMIFKPGEQEWLGKFPEES